MTGNWQTCNDGVRRYIPEDHVFYRGRIMDIDDMLALEERTAYYCDPEDD